MSKGNGRVDTNHHTDSSLVVRDNPEEIAAARLNVVRSVRCRTWAMATHELIITYSGYWNIIDILNFEYYVAGV
jgi:hypothetical protein